MRALFFCVLVHFLFFSQRTSYVNGLVWPGLCT